MPRYYFHVCDGTSYEDLQGTELVDLDSARQEAVRFAGALLQEKPETFWQGNEWSLRVADENDLTLFILSFFATDSPAIRTGGEWNDMR